MAHLVFQTAFPGDLFLSVPLIKRLRAFDPGTAITLACRPGLGEFFLRHKLVDDVIEVNKKIDAGRAAFAKLKSETWDLIVCPHQSPRTAAWMMRLRARGRKIGYATWWNRVAFNARVARPNDFPDALRQLSLLAAIDDRLAEWFASDEIQALKNPVDRTSLVDLTTKPIPEWASMRVLERQPRGRVIFMSPGSVWETKRWTPVGFAAVARELIVRGFEVRLVGSPAERDVCERIARVSPGVTNACGRGSLADLVDDLARGTALISNDSGAAHAAACSGLPTVAVFGPTVLELGYRPWNQSTVIVQKDLPCRPCGKHGHHRCPIGTHACMKDVGPADVLKALDRLI